MEREVLALKPSRFPLVLLAVWSLAIFTVVKSNRDWAEWTQVVELGFLLPKEIQKNPTAISGRRDSVDYWLVDSQELVREDIRITSESWDLLLASDSSSVALRETLGTVIRRNLMRMQGRIGTCMPSCRICGPCDFGNLSQDRPSKLRWSSPLSHYLDHIQQEIHDRNIGSKSYSEKQEQWTESGEQFCLQLASQIIEWRDLNNGVSSLSLLEDGKFITEFTKAIAEIEVSSALYHSRLDSFISETRSLSLQHLQDLNSRRFLFLWGLVLLALVNYLGSVLINTMKGKKKPSPIKAGVNRLASGDEPLPIGVENANTGEDIHWPIRIAEELLEAAEGNSNSSIAGEQAIQEYEALTESVNAKLLRDRSRDSASEKVKCLIIEDNDSIRELMILLLEPEGFQCTGLCTNAGLDSEEIRKYDLLITDVRLGENITDGVRFVREVRKKNLSIPVLLVSGYRLEGSKHVDVLDGETHFLEKPIEAEKFLSAVKNLLCVR